MNRSHSGEKFLDIVDDRVLVAQPWSIVFSRELDGLRAGDVRGEVAAARCMDGICRSVHHQRRDANSGKQMTNVDLGNHSHER